MTCGSPDFHTESMPDFGRGLFGGTQSLFDKTHCDCENKFPGVSPVGAPIQIKHLVARSSDREEIAFQCGNRLASAARNLEFVSVAGYPCCPAD
jgi:hypothetical protein